MYRIFHLKGKGWIVSNSLKSLALVSDRLRLTAAFRTKQSILIFLLLFAFVLPGCSGDRAAELYDTAGFEELQNNRAHALKLYQEIITKYPDSKYAKEAKERIEEIERSEADK